MVYALLQLSTFWYLYLTQKEVIFVAKLTLFSCYLLRHGALGIRTQMVDLEKRMQKETRVNPVADSNDGVMISSCCINVFCKLVEF